MVVSRGVERHPGTIRDAALYLVHAVNLGGGRSLAPAHEAGSSGGLLAQPQGGGAYTAHVPI